MNDTQMRNSVTANSPADPHFEIDGTAYPYPSDAYASQRKSFTFRITDSVLGSLLATYVFGFLWVGFVNYPYFSCPELHFGPWMDPYLRLASAIMMSGIFLMLTAAYYNKYHNSILTMPQVHPGNLRIDFLLATAQAIPYGLAIIFPQSFVFCIGLSLLPIALRQRRVNRQLSTTLFPTKDIADCDATSTSIQNLSNAATKVINDAKLKNDKHREMLEKCWGSWSPLSGKLRFWIVIALVGGIGVIRLYELYKAHTWMDSAICFGHLVALILVSKSTQKIFSKLATTSTPVSPERGFDERYGYDILVKRLISERGSK